MPRQAGHDAIAVREIGLRDAKDSEIWHYALQNHAAILTKDEDFAKRSICSSHPPIVIWLRIGNATNAALLSWFLPLMPAIDRRLQAGDTLIEVR